MRKIVLEYEHNRALQECGLKTLQQCRHGLCVRPIERMLEPRHSLHSLLLRNCSEVKERVTRSLEKIQETERFKRSLLVYPIDKCNDGLNLYFFNSKCVILLKCVTNLLLN